MTNELRYGLARMGYRHMADGKWGKPVGYTLFVIAPFNGKHELTTYFKGANGKLLVWNRQNVEDEESIKFAEAHAKTDTYLQSDFGFITDEEAFNFIL